jgi:hypothetical protein
MEQEKSRITSRHIAKTLSRLEGDGTILSGEDKEVIKAGFRHLADDLTTSMRTENDNNYNR